MSQGLPNSLREKASINRLENKHECRFNVIYHLLPMSSFDFDPPPEPHQHLARTVACQWRHQQPLRAQLVRALASLSRSRPQPGCHPLGWRPATPHQDLEALLEQWARHWHSSLQNTAEGSLHLELRDQINDLRLDQHG